MFSSLFILCSLGLTISSTLALPISTSELGPRQRNRFFGGNRGGAANAGAAAGACSDVMVFFARGTGENAPIGTIVGPPLKRALSSQLQGQTVSFEGTDYPANVQGFLRGGDAAGAANMAQSVTAAATNCPNSTIVMSGYSQGAQVAHLAAGQLSPDVQSQVDAVVTFGDPDRDTALPGGLEANRKTFCNQGDQICEGRAVVLAPHLQYGSDAPAAAQFIASKV